MAHAAIRPFDLALARRLLALDGVALRAWLAASLPELKARTRRGIEAWREALRAELPAELWRALPSTEGLLGHWDDLAAALEAAGDAAEVSLAATALAEKAAFGEERVAVGEAVTLASVFGPGGPRGALSSRTLFPTDGAERYLLLLPEHLEALAAALSARGGAAAEAARGLAVLARRARTEPGLRGAWLNGA
jgi:hypothetical protein